MKKYLLTAFASLLIFGVLSAQSVDEAEAAKEAKTEAKKAQKEAKDARKEVKKEVRELKKTSKVLQKDKLNEYDEIVIKRKDGSADEKVTVEIKDDEVFVNGVPIDDFVDEEIAIQLRTPRRYRLNSSPFVQDGTWTPEDADVVRTTRAFLGVSAEGSAEGAKLIQVSENSPAEKAGLKKDDYINKINDKEVFDHEQIVGIISELKPGDTVTIQYTRNGQKLKTTGILDGRKIQTRTVRRFRGFPEAPEAPELPEDMEAPETPEAPDAPHPGPGDITIPRFRFEFDDNGHPRFMRTRPRLGIKAQDTEDGKGVTIIDIDANSPADKAGLEEDDVITSFEGKEITSAEELGRLSREAGDKTPLKLKIKRKGKSQDIEVKIPKKLKTTTL